MKPLRAALCVPLLVPLAAAQEEPPQPPERPQEPPRGLVLSTDGAAPGYTLFTPLRSNDTYLVGLDGELAHTWKSAHPPGNSVYLLEDGSILRTTRPEGESPFRGGGEGGGVQRIAWDGELLWDLRWSDDAKRQHHDIEPMPNGDVLLISWEMKSAEEAIAAGRDPAQVGESGLWPDALYQIRPVPPDGGEVVWEWHAWDHLVQDHDPARANYGDVTARPGRLDLNADHRRERPMSAEERRRQAELERRMRGLGYVGDEEEPEDEGPADGERERRVGGDWLHLNSVAYEPTLDLVIVSSHTLSEVWVIDHSTTTAEAATGAGGRYGKGGDLLWRWGNPGNYGAPGDQALFRQHDARWLAPGEDGAWRVLVFNNGRGRPGGDWSSVDELVLPFDPQRGFALEPGAAFGPAAPAWSYAAPDKESFYASFISGAERLPNGNTLVCSGPDGRVFEVTRAGELVWDYRMPFASEEGGRGERGGPPGRGDGPPPGFGGPPPREGGPPGRGPRGGGPPGGPPDGPPDGRRGPRGRGPGGDLRFGLFRATRIAPDHPGLARLADDAR